MNWVSLDVMELMAVLVYLASLVYLDQGDRMENLADPDFPVHLAMEVSTRLEEKEKKENLARLVNPETMDYLVILA